MAKKKMSDPEFYDELVKLVREQGKTRGFTRGPIPPEYPPRPAHMSICDEISDKKKQKGNKP